MTTETTPCAVIYVRASSGPQGSASLERQEAVCRAYAHAHGWTVLGAWRDADPAADRHTRPGLAGLRHAVRAGSVGVVLCYTLDRLSRDPEDITILTGEFQQAGARLDVAAEQ